jgi:hypothetical protein
MSPEPSAKTSTEIVIDTRCRYVAASGRRCRAFASRDTSRTSGYSAFCLPHAQMEQQFLDAKSVTKDLIGEMDDFRTNTAVTEVLGKLLKLVAENRIPLRNANAISYICQLLLSSHDGVRRETLLVGGEDYELRIIKESMDTMWGNDEDDEDDNEEAEVKSKEESEEESAGEVEVEAEAEPYQLPATREEFDAQVAATVRIRDGG